MFGGFKQSKLRPQLKMAVHRLQIASNKKVSQIKNQKRDIVKLLSEKPNPKEEKARIRAEALIREDNTVEAYEIIQLNCELLAERIKLIASEKECPIDLISVVSTLIWASVRVDIPELIEVRKQFKSKYGKVFEEAALNNENEIVNERVFSKLSIQPPPALLVQNYLEKICEEFNVEWKPKVPLLPKDMSQPVKPPTGESVQAASGSGYGDIAKIAPIAYPTDLQLDPLEQPPATAPIAQIMPPEQNNYNDEALFNTPGAVSIPYEAPKGKKSLPTAHVGVQIPPPFPNDYEEEDSVSSNQEESFVPDRASDVNNEFTNTREAPSLETPSAPTIHQNNNSEEKDNDDDDDDDGNDFKSDSLRALEARFADLKK